MWLSLDVIRARKGQVLTLSLSWKREDDNRASFTVSESPDFSGAAAKFGKGSHEDTKWAGTIPPGRVSEASPAWSGCHAAPGRTCG